MEAARRRPAVGSALAAACFLAAPSAWRGGAAWLGGGRCRGALGLAPFRSSPASGVHRWRHSRLGRRGRRRGKRAPDGKEEEEWKVRRGKAPAAVQDLVSGTFLRNLRDGGPQARQSEDLPPIDPAWIGADAEETARNVVGALCRHHYGDSVCVDEVLAGTDAARGRDYTVTLALSDRHIFGSCHSTQIGDFDRDTTALLEQLRKLDGWDQRIYKLKVQTPGTDRELSVPEDLWKCELLPCRVHWERDGKRQCRYLHRVPDTNATWQLSESEENYQGGRTVLTKKQRELRYTIEEADLDRVSININSRSLKKLQRAKAAVRLAGPGNVQEALRQLGAAEPEEEEEPEEASEEGELGVEAAGAREEEAADAAEELEEGGNAAEEEVLDMRSSAL